MLTVMKEEARLDLPKYYLADKVWIRNRRPESFALTKKIRTVSALAHAMSDTSIPAAATQPPRTSCALQHDYLPQPPLRTSRWRRRKVAEGRKRGNAADTLGDVASSDEPRHQTRCARKEDATPEENPAAPEDEDLVSSTVQL